MWLLPDYQFCRLGMIVRNDAINLRLGASNYSEHSGLVKQIKLNYHYSFSKRGSHTFSIHSCRKYDVAVNRITPMINMPIGRKLLDPLANYLSRATFRTLTGARN